MSYAEPLGSDIVCKVFTTLTGIGSPVPPLDGGSCPDEPPPPPPPPPPAACADGIDNDEDGLVDLADPGCTDASDSDESNPAPPPPPPSESPQCSDGLDNDSDGKVDEDDPGCTDASDDDEADPQEDGDDTPGPTPEPTPSPTPSPAPTPSPSPSSGSGGGGGSAFTGTLYTSTTTGSTGSQQADSGAGQVLGATVFSTTTESCDRFLTAFIREGKENDADQVKRLQRFLRDFEGAMVMETGTYDAATLAAVHVFQTKYAADILTPWGIKESTGFVYLTTRKKVNEIYCGYSKVFYLTVEEQRKIDEARATSGGAPASPTLKTVAPKSAEKPTASPTGGATEATSATTTKGQNVIERSLRTIRGWWDWMR